MIKPAYAFALLSLTSITLQAAPPVPRETLTNALHLPEYFARKYGDLPVWTRESANTRLTPRYENHLNPKGENIGASLSGFEFTLPPGLDRASSHRILAEQFIKLMETKDSQFQIAMQSLESMGFLTPEHELKSLELFQRVEAYAAKRLMGEHPTGDSIAQLWWELKFSDRAHEGPAPIRKGDMLLFVNHVAGYFQKSNPVLETLQKKVIDFGHSTLGIRYAGMGPENDLIINPGSKNLDLYEVNLPARADSAIPNIVEVANFWSWIETQIYMRYMNLSSIVIPLSSLQQEAILELLPRVKGVEFGPALVFANNCADGSGRLLDFILPIEHVFSPKFLFGIAIPAGIQSKASHAFVGVFRPTKSVTVSGV